MIKSTFLLGAAGCLLVFAGSAVLLVSVEPLRRLQLFLERPWHIERLVYRHHRKFGGLIVASSTLFLILLTIQRGQPFGINLVAWPGGARLIQLIRVAEWGFALFALIVGIFVFIRPSLLKRFEASANRWIEPVPGTAQPAVRAGEKASRGSGMVLMLSGAICIWFALAEV